MRSKTTYINSSLTKKDEWTKQLSSSSKENLQLEAVKMSEKLGIEQPEYLKFLELLFYVSTLEQNNANEATWLANAKTHALKLLAAFGSVKEALAYINRYEMVVKNSKGNAKQLLHDACLFSLPDSDEISDVWQKLLISAKPNGPEDEIMRLLPFAQKIAEYIQNPANKKVLEKMVREEVENDFKRKYELDFKNLGKISLEQWIEMELKNNPKLALNDQLKAELQAAYNDKTPYVQYRLAREKFLPSTIKSKMNTIIPFSIKTPVQYIKKIANTFLYKRADENPEAAELFFKHRIAEDSFNLYLSLTPDNSHAYIPNITLEGQNIHENYKNFRLEKLDSKDPRAAVLGKLTSCCQSLGNEGQACAIHGITDKKSGFYVVYDTEKNNIIAQCWAWYDTNGNLVFDSIEIAMNYNKHKTMIMDFYVKLAHCLVQQHNIPSVLVGVGGATPEGMKILSPLGMFSPENYSGYRDSYTQTLVAAKAFPLLIETYKDTNTDSLLANEPFDGITLSQLQAHQELYLLNNKKPGIRILEQFELHKFTKEAQDEHANLIADWFLFLEEFQPNAREPSLQDIQAFIEKGVNLNTSKGLSILTLACMFGSLQTIKFLMENGALAIQRGNFVSPLVIIIQNNEVEIVKFLLTQKDIDINKPDNYGLTPLMFACREGHTAIVKLLLEQKGMDINKPNKAGETPLMFAFRWGHTAIVKLLLEQKGIDINKPNKVGETPLMFACQGHTAIVELLLEQKGMDINKPNDYEQTPLMFACQGGHTAIVKLLLEQKDIDINKPNKSGETPLMMACQGGHTAIVKLLLEQKNIDINKPNKAGETPLHTAFMKGEVDIAELLLKYKSETIDINKQGRTGQTPLIIACMWRDVALAKLVLEQKGIDINKANNSEETPLMMACALGCTGIVELLLEQKDIDINKPNKAGETPLYVALSKGHIAIAKLLLEQKGIDINKANNSEETPLMMACAMGNIDVAKLLLEQEDIDINKLNKAGETLLYFAFTKENMALAELLLKHEKIDINKPNSDGRTPLIIACTAGSKEKVEFLLKHEKIDVNKPNSDGQTPLIIACQMGHTDLAELLLNQKDIDINKLNNDGETPLSIAFTKGHLAITGLLVKNALETIISYNIIFPASENPTFVAAANRFFRSLSTKPSLDKDSPDLGSTKDDDFRPN